MSDFSPDTETGKNRWEIRGYSFIDKAKGKKLESPVILQAAGALFTVEIFLGGDGQAADGYFSVHCRRERSEEINPDIFAKYAISVVGKNGARMTHGESPKRLFEGGQGWGYKNFGKTSDLEASPFLMDDSISIELQVTAWAADVKERVRILPMAPGSSGSAIRCGKGDQKQRTLARDLAALLASCQGADVDLGGKEASGWTVKAHRVVLAARSPVFNRMLFQSGMRESSADAKIPLGDFDQAIVQQFVRFLYSDELEQDLAKDPDALCHLFTLGHRYEVDSLVEYCADRLHVTEDRAMDLLMMAEQLCIPALKEQVMLYICSCRARLAKVQKTEGFIRMSKNYPNVMVELFARATEPAEKRARVSDHA